MSGEDFKNALNNVSSFVEKLVKVFTDLYLFIKEQLEGLQK